MKSNLLILGIIAVFAGACKRECLPPPPPPPPDPPPSSCVIDLKKGLLAYYPFNGNANDESGNGLNGVVNNGAFFTTDFLGRPGKAAGFDGINDYILVTDNGKLNPPEITIAMMVMTNSTNRRQAIVNKVDFETARSPIYGVGQALDATNRWEFSLVNQACGAQYAYNPNDYATNSETLQAGRWYHLIASFSKGVQKLYVDGQLRVTKPRDFTTLNNCTATQLVIGGWWKNDIVSIDGKADEIRIYNRELNTCEIEELTRIFK